MDINTLLTKIQEEKMKLEEEFRGAERSVQYTYSVGKYDLVSEHINQMKYINERIKYLVSAEVIVKEFISREEKGL